MERGIFPKTVEILSNIQDSFKGDRFHIKADPLTETLDQISIKEIGTENITLIKIKTDQDGIQDRRETQRPKS